MHTDPGEESRWFAAEVHPHEPALRMFLRTRFPTLHDVDDVMQEAYIRLLRARATGPIAAAKAFLFVTAKHLAINRLRDRRLECTQPVADFDIALLSDEQKSVPEALARMEDFQLLIESIEALPERCRQVMTLRKIYGLSQREVAARLGISEHTVEAQSTIGLDKCADYFRSRGYHPRRNA